MDAVTVDRLKEIFTGSVCTGVENLNGYLQLTFGSRRLIVECAWRIIHNRELAVSSGSDGPTVDRLYTLLHGNVVKSAEVGGDFSDLRLEFSDSTVLETFADSEEYEHWKVVGGPDDMIIAGPGRLWSAF